MKKSIAVLGLVSLPVFAAPPILDTDFLKKGEHMLIGGYSHIKVDMDGDSANTFDIESSSSGDLLNLSYGYSFIEDQMLILEMPYTFKDSTKATFNDNNGSTAEIESSREGLGDLSLEYRFLLLNRGNYKGAAWVGTTIPVGDDDTGEPKIIENGVKTQSLKKGGAGSGRNDYNVGLSFSTITGNSTFFTSMDYVLNGSKTEEGEKEEPGNDASIEVGVLQAVGGKSSVGALLLYSYTGKGKDGTQDISSYSTYGVSLAYFFHASDKFIISPQLVYLKMSDRKSTDRDDNTVTKISDAKAFAFNLDFRKIF